MSVNRRSAALGCVKQQKLLESVWAVLMSIASRIGTDGTCFPSIETIGKEANGKSPSTVKRATADAAKLGLLKKTRRNINGEWRTMYSITPPPEPLHFDRSKQSWRDFVRANTKAVGVQRGETRQEFIRRELTRMRVP